MLLCKATGSLPHRFPFCLVMACSLCSWKEFPENISSTSSPYVEAFIPFKGGRCSQDDEVWIGKVQARGFFVGCGIDREREE